MVSYAVGLLSLGIIATGFISDFMPRRWILQTGTMMVMLGSYPLYTALLSRSVNPFALFTMVAVACALVSGTFSTIAAELFPTRLRFTGLAISYNLASIVGGFGPLVTSWSIGVTGDKAAPGAFVALVGAVGLMAALSLRRLQAPGSAGIKD